MDGTKQSRLDLSALIARVDGLFAPDALDACRLALTLREDLGAAAAIHDCSASIARDAAALAKQRFVAARLLTDPHQLLPFERDLTIWGQLYARQVAGTQSGGAATHFLQHLAIAARRGMEFADASALLVGCARRVAHDHLEGAALARYQHGCDQAQAILRHLTAAHALAAQAETIASDAYDRLIVAHPELDQVYGAITRSKCVRDVSYWLGAASLAFGHADLERAGTRWLEWIYERVGRYVSRFGGDIWGSIFACLWVAAQQHLAPAHTRVIGPLLLRLADSGQAIARGLQAYLRAPECAALAAERSVGDGLAAADIPLLQEVSCGYLQVAACQGALPAPSTLWAELHQRLVHLPLGRNEHAEQLLLRSAATARETLSAGFDAHLEAALQRALDGVRRFGPIADRLHQLPQLAADVIEHLGSARLRDVDAFERWLLAVAIELCRLSLHGSATECAERLLLSLTVDLDGASGESAELEAQALAALAKAWGARGLTRDDAHLQAFVDLLAHMATRWPARADANAPAAGDVEAGLAALVARQFYRLSLSGDHPTAVSQSARWIAQTLVPELELNWPVTPVGQRADACRRLVQNGLDQLNSQVSADGRAALLRQRQLLSDVGEAAALAHWLAHHAAGLSSEAVAELARRPLWIDAGMDGMQPRCTRDFALLLGVVANGMGDGCTDLDAWTLRFAAAHLRPFLREDTRALSAELIAIAGPLLQHELSPRSSERVLNALRTAYGLVQQAQP